MTSGGGLYRPLRRRTRMIDFIHPRSKRSLMNIATGILSVVVLFAGSMLVYHYGGIYLEARSYADGMNNLPSGDSALTIAELKTLQQDYSLSEEELQHVKDYIAANYGVESLVIPELESDEETSATPEVDKVATQPAAVAEPAVAGYETTQVAVANTATTEQPKEQPTHNVQAAVESKPIPKDNRLVIPKMQVDGEILEGTSESILLSGIWHIPGTSDDPTSGNMVLSAHRFLHGPGHPESFFLLDTLETGDTFTVYWNGKEYTYKVREIKIVEPNEIDILYNTPNAQVTLFSCTPLFTSEKRLVVIGDLVK